MSTDQGSLPSRLAPTGLAPGSEEGGQDLDEAERRLVPSLDVPGADLASPLYVRLYIHLRDAIFSGDFPEGATLPGEFALCERFRVSRATVRRALDELAGRGLVSRQPGRGTQVRKRPALAPVVVATIDGALERTRVISAASDCEVLEFAEVPAPADVADMLKLREATVCTIVLIRRLDGEPFVHFTSWIPAEVGRSLARADLESSTMLPLLAETRHPIAEIRQTVSAAAANRSVARSLQVNQGAPLLRIERLVLGAGSAPIEWSVALYRHDRHEYRINLQTRNPAAPGADTRQ
ncbi:MAG: GntR family transcriptional regulator [Acetobacteraceae bacterium]